MSEPTEALVCPYCGLEEVTDTSRLDGCGCDGCDPPIDDVPTGKTPALHEQLAASKAREARLREALEPFAESAREMVEIEDQEGFRFNDGMYPADICKFNAGELRRVLSALDADKDEDHGTTD